MSAPGANVWKALKVYLTPGLLIGAIKFASVFVWFFYHPIAAAVGVSDQSYSFSDSIVILLMGLAGVGIAIIGWPVVIYKVFTGSVSLSSVLFYPWVTTL